MSIFTKQHFEIVAATMFNSLPPIAELEARRQHFADCKGLAFVFAKDNNLFDQDMFFQKCGYVSW